MVPQLGASTQAGRVDAEDDPQPTRLGMLRMKLRPIDGATTKFHWSSVALRPSLLHTI